MADAGAIVVGLIAAHDDRDLADALAEDLPPTLRDRVDGRTEWRAEVHEVEPADASATPSELIETVRRHLLDRGWQMGIGLTALPLRAGRRLVTAEASASHGSGLVSIPALGALHRSARLRELAVDVVEGLLGESTGATDRDRSGRAMRISRRSVELASPADMAAAETHGAVRFAGAVALGNLSLFAGMVRANHPTRVMARLSRSATAALGTGAYAVSSSSIWTLADLSTWPRLVASALLSMLLILVSLVVAHGLWERRRDASARERIVLFNIVTVTTLAIGVATLYMALFLVMGIAAAVIIPPTALHEQLGRGSDVAEFARIAWLASSIAMVGGALGSLLESDEAVRDAAYRQHARRPAPGS
jgi:hypothetical protein